MSTGSQPFFQLIDQLLVGGDLRVGLTYMLIEFAVLSRGLRRMVGGIAQCVVKGEIHFMVGLFLCLLRKSAFVFA